MDKTASPIELDVMKRICDGFMTPIHAKILDDRQFIILSGADAATFLQGLITQDIAHITKHGAPIIFTAALNPRGRYVFDFFILPHEDGFLLDVDASLADALHRHLSLFKLRADVHLERPKDADSLAVLALWPDHAAAEPNLPEVYDRILAKNPKLSPLSDPRWRGLGWRCYGSRTDLALALASLSPQGDTEATYERHLLEQGIPTPNRGLIPEKTLPLEANFDHLNAISWTKGCYVGQELTTRTHHQGLVRKRVVPFRHSGPLTLPPEAGSVLYQSQDQDTISLGLARIYLDHLPGLKPLGFYVPRWLNLSSL